MSEEYEIENLDEKPQNKNTPAYGSIEWEKYVMDSFLEDELYIDEKGNRYPTLNGMRRVSLKLLGTIIKSGPTMVVSNLPTSSYCIYEIQYAEGLIFSASADATQENISGAYAIYPTAMAESRAEARAYRKALLLRTASAEEIRGNEKAFNTVLETVKEFDEEDKISQQQISIIETKCKKLKINKEKFLESEGIDLLTAKKSDGVKLSKKISEFQQSGIPEELKN